MNFVHLLFSCDPVIWTNIHKQDIEKVELTETLYHLYWVLFEYIYIYIYIKTKVENHLLGIIINLFLPFIIPNWLYNKSLK